jgi:hypothetical protein
LGRLERGVEVLGEEPDGAHKMFYSPINSDASHGFIRAP